MKDKLNETVTAKANYDKTHSEEDLIIYMLSLRGMLK